MNTRYDPAPTVCPHLQRRGPLRSNQGHQQDLERLQADEEHDKREHDLPQRVPETTQLQRVHALGLPGGERLEQARDQALPEVVRYVRNAK